MSVILLLKGEFASQIRLASRAGLKNLILSPGANALLRYDGSSFHMSNSIKYFPQRISLKMGIFLIS